MSASALVDTNVLVYAVDEDEPEKRDTARKLLAASQPGALTLSAQVLGEFYVTVTRKLARPIPAAAATALLEWLELFPMVQIDAALVKHAVEISRSAQISYWDGLVVAAAARADCDRLLSEDLGDGQKIAGVLVENPFRLSSD
ncbi:MAG TPA: PIN domain-containing protein [Solirubrobacteraceae bacterium]|jgi:predicted nucleic acid-binding protein